MRLVKHIAAVAAFVLVASHALGEEDFVRDLSVVQSNVYSAGTHRPGTLKLNVWVDRRDLTYVPGDSIRIFAQTNEDAYVTVLNVGPGGKVTQLFPNKFQTDNKIRANRSVQIPAPNSDTSIRVSGALGAELIKVIASNQPIKIVPQAALDGAGVFLEVKGGADELAKDLQVMSSTANSGELKIASTNKVIKTVPFRSGQTAPTATVVVMPPGAPFPGMQAPAMPVVTPALPANPEGQFLSIPQPQQPFPLLLAIDKQSYRVGERVVMSVTSLQACHLTVINVSASGTARVVFPNKVTPNNAIAAMQTVLVSGGPSPATFEVNGPAGSEQVIAICSTDPAPILTAALDQSQLFSSVGTRDDLARDLTMVPTRPAGTTGVATLTYAVHP
jgi:hypothetical protein